MAEISLAGAVGGPGAGHVLLPAGPLTPGEQAEQLTDLYRLSDPGLSELTLDELLDEVLIRVREVLGVDTVAILLLSDDGSELVAQAAKGLEAEVEQGVRIPLGRGFAGRIAAERRPIFIPDVDRADVVNPILRDMGIRSMLGVPLIAEAELLGVLHVGSLTPRTFTTADAALLDLAAARVAPGIERARLLDTLRRERLAAETLQRGLLPSTQPQLPEVHTAVRYVPARAEVGGDWYEIMQLTDGRVGIAIGDVVGHGVRAAAQMAQLRAAMRAYAIMDETPSVVLTRLDRYVQHSHPTAMATVTYGVLDPATGTLSLSSAGHPPPLLVGPEGARLLDVPVAAPVGVRPFPHYTDVAIGLGEDETILLYTDGLVERRGEPLGRGLERLRLAAGGTTHPELLCTRVLHELIGPRPADDDVALVALSRSAPDDRLDLRLDADRSSLAPLRRKLRAWLRGIGVGEQAASTIVLAVGEAAANAVEHAYPPAGAHYTVRATVEEDAVVVTVSDEGRWREEPRSLHRGRGLAIMRATMDEVQIDRGEQGTTVVLRRHLEP